MKRVVINFATAVSWLVLAATAGVWVRSYWISDQLIRPALDAGSVLQGYHGAEPWRGVVYIHTGVLDGESVTTAKPKPPNRRVVSGSRNTHTPPRTARQRFHPSPLEHDAGAGWKYVKVPVYTAKPPHAPATGALGFARGEEPYTAIVEDTATSTVTRKGVVRTTALPLYPLVWAALILPVVQKARWIYRKRRGACMTCGRGLGEYQASACAGCGARTTPGEWTLARVLFACGAAVSMALCVATVVAGVITYRAGKFLILRDAMPCAEGMVAYLGNAGFYGGRCYVYTTWVENSWQTYDTNNMGYEYGYRWESVNPAPVLDPDFNFLGFVTRKRTSDEGPNDRGIQRRMIVPLWAPALVLAAPPWFWWRGWRRRRRYAGANLCKSCGYDLTGNTSGVCSECGTKVDERKKMTL